MIGTTLGSYRIVSQLGAGGMGVVYKALDQRLQRHVALKVLPPAVSSDEGRRRRFLQEARAASALNDPHIITIYDIFEHDAADVLVMELVEGRTLGEAVSGPVPVEQAVTWVQQIAEALGLAHGAGIVHRDLKPGNIMITDRGLVKVLDFGLAKVTLTADDATIAPATMAGDVLGTVDYMSPEQARGASVDHRSDIFSLGTILYELLAGRRPFVAENRLALLQEVLYGPITPLRSLRPDISEPIEAVVMKALERDPRMRFQSMWELGSALKFATGASPSTHPPSAYPSAPATGTAHAGVAWPTSTPPVPAQSRAGLARWGVIGLGVLALSASVYLVGWQPWRGRTPAGGAADVSSRAMPVPTTVATPATALEFTQQGLGLLRRFDRAGNVDQSIASFESAVALDTTYAPAWAGLARAYWRQQKETRDASWGARAVDAATQAIALDAYLADGHVSLGLARFVSGDIPASKQALEHALVLDPRNAGAHRGLGDIEENADRLPEAARHYERAMAADPKDWELPRLQGDLEYQDARYAEALKWYTRSAEAAPDSALPYRLMGAASHMLGDYGAAASAFQKSIGIQPNANAYTNLGTALFFQGLYRESLQAFERAVELLPSSALVWGNLADAYRWVPGNAAKSQEAYARAIQMLREQLAKDPSQVANRSRLALNLAKSGDTKGGLAELAKVLTPDVKEVNTLYRGAVTYELAGDRASALTTLERALERGYSLAEVRMDPELAKLRNDVRYHRLIARFEGAPTPR
jgi:eukaryotic-like serine/threonine-protein kinase